MLIYEVMTAIKPKIIAALVKGTAMMFTNTPMSEKTSKYHATKGATSDVADIDTAIDSARNFTTKFW
jgi:hypothetical protein